MTVGSTARYFCGDEERRAALVRVLEETESKGLEQTLNGVDFLEVLDVELVGTELEVEGLRQRMLLVQCYSEVGFETIVAENVRITGGVRVDVGVEWILRLTDVEQPPSAEAQERLDLLPSAGLVQFFRHYRAGDDIPRERILVVGTDRAGDFSTYRLELIAALGESTSLSGFDPRLASLEFSFKVECPSDFDSVSEETCPPTVASAPRIDYLAKDYTSFRRLMLDRLSAVAPGWQERSPADLGVVLVELLAHVGDQLSYYQDAVATEAYLGTARQRISVRRHARLVDYRIREGTNARAWIAVEVEAASNADGATLSGSAGGDAGTRLLTRTGGGVAIDAARAADAVVGGAVAFETLMPVTLRAEHNEIPFYTWSDRACCLPVGATTATLEGALTEIAVGDHLLFEEVMGARTGSPADADPDHCHVVRLTSVTVGEDPLVGPGEQPISVTEIGWNAADALPFALCVSANAADGRYLEGVSVARGNVTIADQGATAAEEELPEVPEDDPYRPRLAEGPLTHALPLPEGYLLADGSTLDADDVLPAVDLEQGDAAEAVPAVSLLEDDGTVWTPQRDLLASGPFSRELVAEIENDGRARLRFGDGEHGLAPTPGSRFTATYRVGNGPAGNVGAGAVAHVVDAPEGIQRARNPLPAFGGEAPESMEEVRRYAPQAFRVQERAVVAGDYADAAERHPEVQQATASFRWTGSWNTVFVTIDRRGGLDVDDAFEARLREHLERFRLAGYDLEIEGPRFVPVTLELEICLTRGYRKSDVVRALYAAFGTRQLADGSQGLFHPDRWTFGQAVDLSPIYAAASAVQGVASVTVRRFERRGVSTDKAVSEARVPIGRLEIARLDNDPDRPEHGRLILTFGGGA